jgi:hypothetical protein
MIGDLLNVNEAAVIIGCTPGRVRQMCRDKMIAGVKANEKAWMVPRDAAEKMAGEPSKTGRPRSNR